MDVLRSAIFWIPLQNTLLVNLLILIIIITRLISEVEKKYAETIICQVLDSLVMNLTLDYILQSMHVHFYF